MIVCTVRREANECLRRGESRVRIQNKIEYLTGQNIGHRTRKKSILIPIPKQGGTKECANHWTIALFSHASKVVLKILHARFQHYTNQELPDVQIGFRKGRGTRDQIAHIRWIMEKAREFQKNMYFCFID